MDPTSLVNDLTKRPTILVPLEGSDPFQPGCSSYKVTELIKKSGGDVFQLNYKNPEVNCIELKNEVESIVKNLTTPFISRNLLRTAEQDKVRYTEIGKIINDVKKAMHGIDGLVLKGGEDIQPIFYGQIPHEKTEQTKDLRRDVYECAALKEADVLKLPVFGICRGLQLGNIWYGGTLNQHVEGHNKSIQTYSVQQNQVGVVPKLVFQAGNALKCDSRHHQTVCKIGENLTVTARYKDGTIKALEGLHDRFLVFVQWHPETCQDEGMKDVTSPENFEFFKEIVHAATRT